MLPKVQPAPHLILVVKHVTLHHRIQDKHMNYFSYTLWRTH